MASERMLPVSKRVLLMMEMITMLNGNLAADWSTGEDRFPRDVCFFWIFIYFDLFVLFFCFCFPIMSPT